MPIFTTKKPTRRQVLAALLIFVVLAVAVYFTFFSTGKLSGQDPSKQPRPVAAATVKSADMPIWINAIGTLVPRNLVTIRTRIEGELQKLAVEEGQLVKAGQVLAEIDPRPLQAQLMQANGQLTRDTALLKNAQLDLERYRTLLEKDAISRQQVDTQDALVRQYQGAVEIGRGIVANAQLQLSYTRITAPVAGRVGLRQVDPGNVVKPGDVAGIMVLAQVDPILAVFSVPEINLPAVTAALSTKEPAVVEVWDRGQKQRLATGRLLTADNLIDTTTGTLKLKAEFANKDSALFPNQFVNVRLATGVLKNAKVVPVSAILRGAKGNYVYEIANGKVKAVPVKLGPVLGDLHAIEGDIVSGAQIVSDGADKLRDGAEVNVVSAEERAKATSDEGKPKKKGKRPEGGERTPPRG